MAKNLKVGDLVWAKMRNFPPWPGKIAKPPSVSKSPKKTPCRYVFFFGSRNYAWVPEDSIVPHSRKMLEKQSRKKCGGLKKAIKAFIRASKKTSRKSEGAVSKVLVSKSPVGEKPKGQPKNPDSIAPENVPPTEKTYEDFVNDFFNWVESKEFRAREELPETPPPDLLRIIRYLAFDSSGKLIGRRTRTSCPSRTIGFLAIDSSGKLVCRSDRLKSIGFLASDSSGERICRRIQKSGRDVKLWSRRLDSEFYRPADVVATTDIVFSRSAGDREAKLMFFGEGVHESLKSCPEKDKGYVELTSMVEEKTSEAFLKAFETTGRYLQVTVAESEAEGDVRDHLCIAAGDESLFDDVKGHLAALSYNQVYVGTEVGLPAKLNSLLKSFVAAVNVKLYEQWARLEAFRIRRPLKLIRKNFAQNRALEGHFKSMLYKGLTYQICLEHLKKNLSPALLLFDVSEETDP